MARLTTYTAKCPDGIDQGGLRDPGTDMEGKRPLIQQGPEEPLSGR